MNEQQNAKSPHILNASSNLLGLCFVVLTSLKYLKAAQRTVIDEIVMVAIILFMLSCVLSFLSIRGNIREGGKWEKMADVLFLVGILVVFVTTILILFNLIE
jgi:heme/copper-type cytochrome/quinol oxidase subunit 4